MQTIIPAIIPTSREHLEISLARVAPFANEVQIDIVDGQFVPFTSWPYVGSGSVHTLAQYVTAHAIEVDLMVMLPETVIDVYANAGVARMVVHLESTNDLSGIIAHRKKHEYQLGLSILNDTPLELLLPHIPEVDYVQLMGIKDIGSQGQPFDERVLERIATLRATFPDLVISIDGSVNRDTIPRLAEAGANRLVSGSAIFSAENPYDAYMELTRLSQCP